VDIVLSIGAGTVVVIAASGGEALFSRTLTSANGRRTTERIASELSIGEAEAELYKRLGATNDPTSALAMLATRPSVLELVDEVRASLEFYADQPSARRIRRLLVTGGGSLLPGLASALSDQLGLDVLAADPFENVRMGHTGFEPCDLPYLAPYMAAAVGVALGATRPKDRRIDLNPVAKRTSRSLNPRRMLVGVGAVVLVGAAGAFYVNGRGALADEQEKLSTAQVRLADVRAQIIERDAAGDPALIAGAASSEASPAAVAASVAATNIDWIAVEAAVRAGSIPLGVVISSFQGVLEPAVEVPAATLVPASGDDPTASTVPPDIPAVDPAAPSAALGTVTLTATAPNLLAIADWLDSIAADPRFADSWASGITVIAQPDGSSLIQLTMEMDLTMENLVDHIAAVEVPA
jgi:hypothetical protein